MRGIYEDAPRLFSEVDSGFVFAVLPIGTITTSMRDFYDLIEIEWKESLGADRYEVIRSDFDASRLDW